MTRTYATLTLRIVLIIAVAFGAVSMVSSFSQSPPAYAKQGKGKGGENGHGGQKGSKHDEKSKKDKSAKGKGKGADDHGNSGRGNGHVLAEPALLYSLDVRCEPGDGWTTCQFTPQVPNGGHKAIHTTIPPEAICAPVIGGDAQLMEPDPVTGIAGYTSTGSEGALTLVLDGQVSTSGSTTYWVEVTGAILPASGPGVACAPLRQLLAQSPTPVATTEAQATLPAVTPATVAAATAEATTELTDTTGSIVVELLNCPITTIALDYDWFGKCEPAAEGERFRLVSADEGSTDSLTVVTDAGGHARFSQLDPDTYELTQLERDWCHAESDGVDDQGNVVVVAGQRTTVWVFTCAGAAASPVATP